ncbi:hypothetical protein SAMN02746073_2206 [Legionella jamestowniensis DSM 19215]|uniref:Uncharacterized protein n=1 Tax=Legionella jamestowniensis TaxID=455 RepID=A0A0W0UGQ0_9GAMM|nr:hypothetical protein Ljam_0908 [Legionella jamestowniensis]SFL84351.1 hypothetical protein SAMN02746073_2206 [Legionella jamestowniensis DSM 19215]
MFFGFSQNLIRLPFTFNFEVIIPILLLVRRIHEVLVPDFDFWIPRMSRGRWARLNKDNLQLFNKTLVPNFQ